MLQACNLMTNHVACIHPKASLGQAIELMADLGVSALPVIDISGTLVGILTASDLLRRANPQEHRALLAHGGCAVGARPTGLARHEQIVEDVMTPEPCTVEENTPLMEVARLMKARDIKRLPVVHGDKLVGMIGRGDVRCVLGADFDSEPYAATPQDAAIKQAILGVLRGLNWTPSALVDVSVNAGEVEMQGSLLKEEERVLLRSAVETIPGVRRYADHLILAEGPQDMFPRFLDEGTGWPKVVC